MRILVVGLIIFVIWAVLSVWLYVDILMPEIDLPAIVQSEPETQSTPADSIVQPEIADSVAQPEILLPGDILIYFDFDDTKPKIDPQIDESVVEFNKWFEGNPESVLFITGHADSTGASEYNMKLGLARGRAALDYLQGKGVDASEITVDSKGEDQPVNDQASEEERSKNRRAVITILK